MARKLNKILKRLIINEINNHKIMEKNLYIDASHPNETRVVLKSGENIEDYEYEGLKNNLIKNNIYLGKVSRIEPSLQAAFVDFGRERHGFLSFNDIQSDYYQIPKADLERIKEEEEKAREELSREVEAKEEENIAKGKLEIDDPIEKISEEQIDENLRDKENIVEKENLKNENVEALKKGLVNLERHISNIKKFGLTPIVAVNSFILDTKKEISAVKDFCKSQKVEVSESTHWADGGKGAKDLAKKVVKICKVSKKKNFKFLYEDNQSLWSKVETIAKEIYKASSITSDENVKKQLKIFEDNGYGKLPVCIAKTQYSFSVDPKLKGAPTGHEISIREVRLSSGAEFIVVVCGSIMTMPGLPRVPAADKIKLNKKGDIEGLF